MPESSTATACDHCGLPLPAEPLSEEIKRNEWRFCCDGCRRVCLSLFEAGLEGYYDRIDSGQTRLPPPPLPEPPSLYDIDDLLDDVSKSGSDTNRREATFLVEGLHCAACVWLIERSMTRIPGVSAIEVNLSNRRLHLFWDQTLVPLSSLLQRLHDIGYAAVPYSVGRAEEAAIRSQRSALYRLGYAGFATMNLMWLSVALWTGADDGSYASFIRITEMVLATPVLFYSGWPFLRGAVAGIRAGVLTMDIPVVLGAVAVFGYSAYITLATPLLGEVYFDTMSAFIFVLLAGRYLEMNARSRSADATVRILELQPRSARRVNADGVEEMVSIKKIDIGDRVAIRPGELIPVDGTILEGSGGVDESMITGESVPVTRSAGDHLLAGSLNDSGAYLLEVNRRVDDTFLHQMAGRLEKALSSRAPAQRYADAIVPWFVGGTILLAGGTFYYWLSAGLETALMYATAVLVVTCPCALGLATPLAVAHAIGLGARHGIIVKHGAALEMLAKTTDVVFDKTGSLTEGEYRFRSIAAEPDINEYQLLQRTASVQQQSEHPLARATVSEAARREIALCDAVRFVSHKGLGVSGELDGNQIVVGNRSLFKQKGIAISPHLETYTEREEILGLTTFFIAQQGICLGAMAFGDRLREDAYTTVSRLHAENISVTVYTGDRKGSAEGVMRQLPSPIGLQAEMRPAEKEAAVELLKGSGKVVVMVGDGVNDALALARSDVGIALASGSDVSAAAADLLIVGGALERLLDAISLGRGMMRRVRQNLFISIAYNVIMVPLAVTGFVSPVVAALAMPLSSLAVIVNASRVYPEEKEQGRWM